MKLAARIYDIYHYVPICIQNKVKYDWAISKVFQQNRYIVLNWLCIYGHYDVVRDMIEDGRCDIHFMSSAPLRFAITYGHYEIVELLLLSGANANAHDGDPMRIACEYGFDNIVSLLITYGVKPTNDDLCRAIWMGQIDCVRLLIKSGLNPMHHRSRALRYAIQRGHFDILDYLRSRIDYPITYYYGDGDQSISSSSPFFQSSFSSSERIISSSSPDEAYSDSISSFSEAASDMM